MLLPIIAQAGAGFWPHFFVARVPVIFLIVFFILLFLGVKKRNKKIQDLSIQHMQTMQTKADKTISLLEEIRDQHGGGA